MTTLHDKVAVISGAASGIGKATAQLFVERGARVLAADVDAEGLRALSDAFGDSVRHHALDVTDETQWQAAIAAAEEAFGPVSALVNSAGILHTSLLEDYPLVDYRRVIEVNMIGTFLGIKSVIPSMRRAGGGAIVNLSSCDGMRGSNGINAYNASKWGVRGLSKSAAMELGRYGIRVNSVHPGGTDTPMGNPMGYDAGESARDAPYQNQAIPRIAESLDIARTIAFIASDDASYTTGAEFCVDGGLIGGVVSEFLPMPDPSKDA